MESQVGLSPYHYSTILSYRPLPEIPESRKSSKAARKQAARQSSEKRIRLLSSIKGPQLDPTGCHKERTPTQNPRNLPKSRTPAKQQSRKAKLSKANPPIIFSRVPTGRCHKAPQPADPEIPESRKSPPNQQGSKKAKQQGETQQGESAHYLF